jgi:hypothetical protein
MPHLLCCAVLCCAVRAIPHHISQAELDAETPLVSYEVKVTNTGTVDADDAVLGFLTPPQVQGAHALMPL